MLHGIMSPPPARRNPAAAGLSGCAAAGEPGLAATVAPAQPRQHPGGQQRSPPGSGTLLGLAAALYSTK